MNSENIFKLLLIVLLISNNHGDDCDCNGDNQFEGLSNVILLALLLGFLGNSDQSVSASDRAQNTTF